MDCGLKTSEQTLSALSLYLWIIQYSPLVCWQSINIAVLSEERGGPVFFLPNVMDWLLPIVADILLSVLPTAKWACVRQFSRQQLCFHGYLSMLWTPLASLTCFAAICSLVLRCIQLYILTKRHGTCMGSFDLLIPEMDCKSFLLHGHLCHVAVRLHFPSRISNKYFLWCDWELKTDQQDFHSFIRASTSMWHRTHLWALWTACISARVSAVVSPLIFQGTRSSEKLAVWELWMQEYYPEEPPPGKLVKNSDNTNFKIKSSILYICNVNIIYFLLCCILWEFYPYVWKESYFYQRC